MVSRVESTLGRLGGFLRRNGRETSHAVATKSEDPIRSDQLDRFQQRLVRNLYEFWLSELLPQDNGEVDVPADPEIWVTRKSSTFGASAVYVERGSDGIKTIDLQDGLTDMRITYSDGNNGKTALAKTSGRRIVPVEEQLKLALRSSKPNKEIPYLDQTYQRVRFK